MKNAFFALAFMLIGSLSFASTGVAVEEVFDGSVDFELSCGIEGTMSWEGDDVTTGDLIEVALILDDLLC